MRGARGGARIPHRTRSSWTGSAGGGAKVLQGNEKVTSLGIESTELTQLRSMDWYYDWGAVKSDEQVRNVFALSAMIDQEILRAAKMFQDAAAAAIAQLCNRGMAHLCRSNPRLQDNLGLQDTWRRLT
jgi:hypothetical protein